MAAYPARDEDLAHLSRVLGAFFGALFILTAWLYLISLPR